ncbi:MAG: DUF2842 domain-containing protein [Alphaproteobacteria bacterium]|nr:DUF2842 domain-containing protein [Alphaproteobacteria bacterium]
MALSYKARRRLSVLVLMVGLPVYIVLAVAVASSFERQSTLVELLIYVVLGVGWVFPLKFLFQGIGKEDPDKSDPDK